MDDETAGGMPSNIMNVVLAVLLIIVWIFLIRRFVYPRFSRRRAENLQLARLVYSGVLAVALVFVAEMLTLSGPLEDAFILASALCFAVSVPCLATMVLLITAAINGEAEQEWSAPVEWISAIGEVAFYAGIASVFFHYHWGAGVAFLVTCSLVAYIGWSRRTDPPPAHVLEANFPLCTSDPKSSSVVRRTREFRVRRSWELRPS